jgi:hypothetical protein
VVAEVRRWHLVGLLLIACVVLPGQLRAQIWMGDTSFVRERRPTRGWFYVDTTESIGWMRYDYSKPWIELIAPPAEYWDWWQETARCQNLSTSWTIFRRYRFFLINRETFGGKGPAQVGYWGYHLPDSMAIYLARSQRNNKALIMHEITHALMHIKGETPGHPLNRFGRFGCGFRYVE